MSGAPLWRRLAQSGRAHLADSFERRASPVAGTQGRSRGSDDVARSGVWNGPFPSKTYFKTHLAVFRGDEQQRAVVNAFASELP